MATSLIGGLIASETTPCDHIWLHEPSTEKANQLKNQYDIQLMNNNGELIEHCDVVVIAVKPQVLKSVLSGLSESFEKNQPLLVSVVAGIPVSSIQSWLNSKLAIARVMPNTPALIGQGASGLFANAEVSEEQRSITEKLIGSVGIVEWVGQENDIDSITALSGSGPAYFMLFIQSLAQAAVEAGIAPETATRLATQTALGSASLVASSECSLEQLIKNVTSPNGTTERALMSFADDDLTSVVRNAFEAARIRSEELAEELG